MSIKTWFITGAGRGFGRQFAEAALERGDRVAATARDARALTDLTRTYGDALLPLTLDVTDKHAVEAAIAATHKIFGVIDVVVNNAGFGLFGMIEEITETQLRQQLEVNLFGPFHVTQAALPLLRQQGHGHIVQISTVGGVVAFPNLGGYHASKWALEGMTEALAQEVEDFGISVTLVEPAGYATDWSGASAVNAEANPVYDEVRARVSASWANQPAEWTGNPDGVGPALLEVVDSPAPPRRVFFGAAPSHFVPQAYQGRLDEWKAWEELSKRANG